VPDQSGKKRQLPGSSRRYLQLSFKFSSSPSRPAGKAEASKLIDKLKTELGR
jgi:hypothetical protein